MHATSHEGALGLMPNQQPAAEGDTEENVKKR
jgi:hypothetical protein